MREVARLII